jgi:hypothetical protein
LRTPQHLDTLQIEHGWEEGARRGSDVAHLDGHVIDINARSSGADAADDAAYRHTGLTGAAERGAESWCQAHDVGDVLDALLVHLFLRIGRDADRHS